jgi:hypothetical protein
MSAATELLRSAFLRHEEGRREIPGFAALPDAALPVCLDYWWDRDRLSGVVSTLPLEAVPLHELLWTLDVPWGRTPAGPYTHTMRQVIEAPQLFPSAHQRVLSVDLREPIVLSQMRNGRWVVLDGFHRIAKAFLLQAETVSAVRLPQGSVPAVLRQEGLFGELNRLRDLIPNLVPEAREAARSLKAEGLR